MDRLLIMFVQDFLAGDLPLERLQRLLIDITWDKSDQASPETLALAKKLDLYIAEFTGGHISEIDLKNLSREAAGLNSYVVSAGEPSSEQVSPKWHSAVQTDRRIVAFG
jgi:hypothetical protein